MAKQAHSRQLALAVNSGSSSLKIGYFDIATEDCAEVLHGVAEDIGRDSARFSLFDSQGAVILTQSVAFDSQESAFSQLSEASHRYLQDTPVVVGHRIVHGGPALVRHQLITSSVISTLRSAQHFAPLHIPQSLKLVESAQRAFRNCPHIACFDTAFHQTMPEIAKRIPLPSEFRDRGIQRYGFHGLSYESIVHRLGERRRGRVIMAHLGNGSSLCALRDGVSVDTTMGMTPTGGVVMGTRSGDLDPGVLLFLLRSEKKNIDDLEILLNQQSGLRALSDGESDMRHLLVLRSRGSEAAELAVSSFVTAIRKAIGAYAALLGGIDLLVFTGGIGEHSQDIRELVCDELAFLDLSPRSRKVVVMPTEEERQIARICRSLTLVDIAGATT